MKPEMIVLKPFCEFSDCSCVADVQECYNLLLGCRGGIINDGYAFLGELLSRRPTLSDSRGRTFLHRIIYSNSNDDYLSYSLVRSLLRKTFYKSLEKCVDCRDFNGRTPLHYMAMKLSNTISVKDQETLLGRLIELSDLSAVDRSGAALRASPGAPSFMSAPRCTRRCWRR